MVISVKKEQSPQPMILTDLLARHQNLRMHAHDGLMLDGRPLTPIARDHGTPAWIMSATTIRGRYAALAAALAPTGAHIHYAVKANDHLAILTLLARCGAGADVVSLGELTRALRAGIPPARIVFSGVGKSADELTAALTENIAQINIESAEELDQLAAIATRLNRPARIAFRLNPDIDAGTHHHISTGRLGDKFGIPIADIPALYTRASEHPCLIPVGLALHIGSQITSPAPYRAAFARTASLVRALRAAGHTVTTLDCGGGLGIAYADEAPLSLPAYTAAIAQSLVPLDLSLMVEPGRYLVGPAGLLLARVILRKNARPRPFLVLDAAMTDLARPALYGAFHAILPLAPHHLHAPLAPLDVVGPVCESTDVLARARPLPPLEAGDFVAILDTGAYGAVMSSTYNARPLAPQILIDGARADLIRPRQPLAELWQHEIVPPAP